MKYTAEQFESYFKFVAGAKKISAEEMPKLRESLSIALGRIYRAVAFDIDGTLTAICLAISGSIGTTGVLFDCSSIDVKVPSMSNATAR